jgi:YVTN family beta-propeller protein
MRGVWFLTIAFLFLCTGFGCRQASPEMNHMQPVKRITLPNGWHLTPAGTSLPLGDLPLNMALSPSGKYLAVTNNGQSTQTLQLIDLKSGKEISSVVIPKAWLGLAFSGDEQKLYASGGNDNRIVIYRITNQRLVPDTTITLGEPWTKTTISKISPAGLCLDEKRQRLYVVCKEDSSLYICDTRRLSVTARLKLSAEPYTCLMSPVSRELYLSLWGGEKVIVVDTQSEKIIAEIPTESHPNDMVMTERGDVLFVSNGNSNSVSVIDTKKRRVVETLNTALYPNAPTGSTPNSVALSADDHTLYVANADNNCLAVFDVETAGASRSKGFIPTGWYPTCVRVSGGKILVTNGKGFSSFPNSNGPNPLRKREEVTPMKSDNTPAKKTEYIGSLMHGTLSIIPEPNAEQLATYSTLVYQNTPYSRAKETEAEGEPGNPIPTKVGDPSPIKYVFYIIKENRTYDQVLGDVAGGNGDTSLCIFGERVTPNQHALANEFVLLDNFYVDAEVSADGHNWSTAAYANDYVEKNWPTSYGGRGGTYDFEGSRRIAYPLKGFIWDYCHRAGISYRTYGEFTDFADNDKAAIPALDGHVAKGFPNFNMTILDIDREKLWERDFDSLLARDAVPRFSTIRLGNDHTSGLRPGAYTPFASVADNDLAVGRLVAHLSKTKIWNESVVFILEDDAQNGPDHVDAHRSTAYLAGGFVKRGFIDHTLYSTSGMLRTMELILGLPPMSQYDAAATPMWRCFQKVADSRPFTLREATVDIRTKNVAWNPDARRSMAFDFSREDAAPDLELNQIIWRAVRGENAVMPAPRRSAFVRLDPVSDDDED